MHEDNPFAAPQIETLSYRVAKKNRYRHIGGLLILPMIGLGLAAIVGSLNALEAFGLYGVIDPWLATFFMLRSAAIAVSAVAGLVLMFLRSRYFPRYMIGYLLGTLLLTLAAASLSDNLSWAGDLIRIVFVCAVWIPYFRASLRVKGTFVK